jgi:hypothetical protein
VRYDNPGLLNYRSRLIEGKSTAGIEDVSAASRNQMLSHMLVVLIAQQGNGPCDRMTN